jgi:hypothetical protein
MKTTFPLQVYTSGLIQNTGVKFVVIDPFLARVYVAVIYVK